MVVIGVDTGGTFTDFIYIKDGKTGILKILSTPDNPAKAVIEGVNKIALQERKNIVHGSTVATNAVLEKKGAKVALITNKNFEDVIEIGRQNRTELYNLHYRKNPPLVDRNLRFGIKGRITKTSEEIEDIDISEIEKLISKLKVLNVESVAVSLLFSFLNPEHEKEIKEILEKNNFPVSVSHEIVPEFREYERTSTTVLNAYVLPKMKNYIFYLENNLNKDDILRIMQSNGGSISAKTVEKEPIRTILSGPAGGVVGAKTIANLAGFEKIITFDMGGTSTDVSLIDKELSISTESHIEGYPIKVPTIDIHTVGAGGGSIAYLDEGGSLNVGPESAGADPGPICYGKGEQITVTDANLFLGRLLPDHFLGGKMELHVDQVIKHFKNMSKKLNLTEIQLAEGILEIANIKMEKALRTISIERGFNPQEFTLVSFGGAGGLHAVFLAKMLNISKVLIPQNPGILSAVGMVLSDIIKDYSMTVMLSEKNTDYYHLSTLFNLLEKKAVEEIQKEGISPEKITINRYLDMRYKGQSFEITVPFSKDFIKEFHQAHQKLYGYKNPDREVEIVNIRIRGIGETDKFSIQKYPLKSEKISPEAILDERDVVFERKSMKTKIIDRDKLEPGNRIEGNAVIVEYSSTTVIPPYATVFVDQYKNLVISLQG